LIVSISAKAKPFRVQAIPDKTTRFAVAESNIGLKMLASVAMARVMIFVSFHFFIIPYLFLFKILRVCFFVKIYSLCYF